jgi:hypothetical protein
VRDVATQGATLQGLAQEQESHAAADTNTNTNRPQ